MNSSASIFAFLLLVVSAVVAADNDDGDLPSTVITANSNNKNQVQMRESFKKALAPYGFPDDDTFHASCHMSVLLPSTTCVDAKAQAENLIKTNVDTGEGSEYKGTMSIHNQGDDWIWSSRLTYDKKYTDDQLFEFATPTATATATDIDLSSNIDVEASDASSSSSCLVTMRSRSQSLSVLDFGVNYCNLWNVVSRLSGFDSPATDSPVVSHCKAKNVPSDPVTTCARY